MSTTGRVTSGDERICPHCRATILRSASVCPICAHSLRYNAQGTARDRPALSVLNVEGTVRHTGGGERWEYSMVLSIRNDRGEEITRQMVGVGALNPDEARTFAVSVEVFKQGVPENGKGR